MIATYALPEPDSKPTESKMIQFTPSERMAALQTIKNSDSSFIHLVPLKHYNSYEINQVFEALLADRENLSKRVILNIPWARPGSWVGCNSCCEALEEEVIQHYKITRHLVE